MIPGSIGFRGTIKGTKNFFFDRDSVTQKLDKATKQRLSRFGYFTLKDSRQSIRKRKKPSRPGQAPTNQNQLLKRFIYFSYDSLFRSVVIGPVQLGGAIRKLQVPRVLEEGGSIPNKNGRKPSKIDARPYMGPAFRRQIDKQLPGLWRDAIG